MEPVEAFTHQLSFCLLLYMYKLYLAENRRLEVDKTVFFEKTASH